MTTAHFSRLTSRAFDRQYYEEHKAEGLDYAAYGPWQRDYAAWLRDCFGLHDRLLLDVGTACGALAHGFTMAGVHATGIDVSEAMITIGRRRQQYEGSRACWPFADDGQPTRLEVCDAANLHLFAAESFDFVHSHQSAEHWPAELVPRILRELARVARPASRFFCVLDTSDLAARSGRHLAAEDPTHVCIRPLAWWHEQLALAGWRVTTEDHRPTLIEHPLCYFGRPGLDWDWWAAGKV